MKDLLRKVRHKGFIGPYYSGLAGKTRFVLESLIGRDELILSVTPDQLVRQTSSKTGVPLQLHQVRSYAELEPYAAAFDRAYYAGYIRGWKAPFTWGERAVIGTVNGELACYNWVQEGTAAGFPTYYGPLLHDEARVLRAGVLPSFRNSGINRAMKIAILSELFERGVKRVFVEVYLRNVPSMRSLMSVGFRPIGLITVLELGPARNFIRWRSHAAMLAALHRLGVSMPP